MRYIELKDFLRDFTVFSLSDIKKADNNFYKRRLNEWKAKGYIKKIIKGYYIFSDLALNESMLYEIANRIYSPSYISFEMALSYYHLVPESVYSVTSATTRKTYTFNTEIAQFNYRTVKPDLFFGYELIDFNDKTFKISSMEKAILDYFYINPHIKEEDDFASLRLNTELFMKKINEKKLYQFLDRFHQKALTKRIKRLMEFIKNA
ncbi:MAG: hypothetical protein ABH868_06485 [bacterium]